MKRMHIAVMMGLLLSGLSAAAGFDFDNGTVQGWTLTGAMVDGNGPYVSNFMFGWKDPVNYPGTPGNDPSGNNLGSAQMFTFGGHGIGVSGTWWIMQFHSPDLSGNADWQTARGYTVKLAECMVTLGTLYANLYVRVYDHDQAKDRYFYNGDAAPMAHCVYGSQPIWNSFTFDWSGISTFPTNFTIKEVFVNIWGKMAGAAYEGGVYLDEVSLLPGPPTAPSNLETHVIGSQVHVTWQDNAANETGYKIQYKRWPRLGFEPIGWTDAATLGPNAQSYQHDSATYNYYYKFRVCAFNDVGESPFSNEDSVLVGLYLDWISITHPNGGEKLPVGAQRDITWTSGKGIATVRIDYSTDGGSTWRSPSITASTPNDGAFLWTVPNTLSSNCLIRIRDAADGFSYDLSNHPFSIVPAAPDLVVDSITLTPTSPFRGKPCIAEVVIRNQGSVNAGGFWVDWFKHRDTPPAPGSYSDQYEWVSGLAVGASKTLLFNTIYPLLGDYTAYAVADTSGGIAEADETNNTGGPEDVQVILKGHPLAFETHQETSNANQWFGGDDRPGMTRNVGAGQSIILAREAKVQSAAFHFSKRFDYFQSPTGAGHAVELALDVRSANGTILRSVPTSLPASFNGGWVSFAFGDTLWLDAETPYIFTCYLKNGENLKLNSSIMARSDDVWPLCTGYDAVVTGSPANMQTWSNWQTKPWDFNIRLNGQYLEPHPGDLDCDWMTGLADAAILADNWLRQDCLMLEWCDGCDLNWNSAVGLADFAVLSAFWQQTFPPPSYDDLNAAKIRCMDQHGRLSTAAIDGSDGNTFNPGTYFAYKTSGGRPGKFIVENWEPATNKQLTIGWVTYNADGTVYSSGTGLVIRGTYACDLDAGTETSTGNDFRWVQSSSTVRYLAPTNTARFALIHRAP